MKILIIGADGQLGTDLCRVIPQSEQIPLTLHDLDITDREKTFRVVEKFSPDVVVNTAAYHRVDDCEDHEEQAFAVNTLGARNVAQAAYMNNAIMVYFSSDYVFSGEKGSPYLESDAPDPQSVYGISKLAGEYCIKNLLKKYFIIRTAGLYGVVGCMGKEGGNFIENMLSRAQSQPELRVVCNEVVSPTFSFDLAQKVCQLMRTPHFGLYHIVNHGQCSWYDFTVKIFALLGKKVKITPVSFSEYPTKARRPQFSALKNARLAELGMDDIRNWPEALKAYLMEKGHLVPA